MSEDFEIIGRIEEIETIRCWPGNKGDSSVAKGVWARTLAKTEGKGDRQA